MRGNCMSDLNVPLADEKTEGPSEVLCFLGLELDTIKMEDAFHCQKYLKLPIKSEKLSVRSIQL